MPEKENDNSQYWDLYYSSDSVPELPSQFCVFIASEFPDLKTIVEFGCGNGRDSLFFARHGRNVIGIDSSEAGISHCSKLGNAGGLPTYFLRIDVTEENCAGAICDLLDKLPNETILVYARFFIHAISDEAQLQLLKTISAIGVVYKRLFLAVEFRTPRDAGLQKATSHHYRRYIDGPAFAVAAAQHGFALKYHVEGFGFAKFRQDDAYVARMIFELT